MKGNKEFDELHEKWMEGVTTQTLIEWLLLGYRPINDKPPYYNDPDKWKLRDDVMPDEIIVNLQKQYKTLRTKMIAWHNRINTILGNPTTNETYTSVMKNRFYLPQRKMMKKGYKNYTVDNPPSEELLWHYWIKRPTK